MKNLIHKYLFSASKEEDFLTGMLTLILKRSLQKMSTAEAAGAIQAIFQLSPSESDIRDPGQLSLDLRSCQEDTRNIPDLTIRGADTHLVIEVKARSPESAGQLKKYARSLSSAPEKYKGLVFLTGMWEAERKKDPGFGLIEFRHIRWSNIIRSLRTITNDEITSYFIDEFEHLLRETGQIYITTGNAELDRLLEARGVIHQVLDPFRRHGLKLEIIPVSRKEKALVYGGYIFYYKKPKSAAYNPCLYIDRNNPNRIELYLKKQPLPKTMEHQIRSSLERIFPDIPKAAVQVQRTGVKTTFFLHLPESGYLKLDDPGRIKLVTAFATPILKFLRRA
ncbi:MAG: PD-(D/E)XK nuclease family protein [Rectinemataceae bacterium]|nr:PD-(D/E)XK nuclease family protein [Rectinemataceae bacterium]